MGFVVLRSMIRGAVQWITNLYFLNLFNLSDKDLDVTFICILFDSSKSLFQKNKISERLTMLFWGGKKTTTKIPPKQGPIHIQHKWHLPLSSQTGHVWRLPQTVSQQRCSFLPCWKTLNSCPEIQVSQEFDHCTVCAAKMTHVHTMRTAFSMSQSLKMMRGDFPPSSNDTFLTLLIAQLWTDGRQSKQMKKVCRMASSFDGFANSVGPLTFSWCASQFQWNLWTPVFGRRGGQTGADPRECLDL